MKILYLYAEVMGYTMSTIKALVDAGAELHIVYMDDKKLTPYKMPVYQNVYIYPRSTQNRKTLQALTQKIAPNITVVSGWMDKDYLKVAQMLQLEGKIVVMGLDGQWYGKPSQYLAMALGVFRYFNRYFSHAWVAGAYQYEYARRLGFRKQEIIFDLYSADLDLFQSAYQARQARCGLTYPHRFLFVGRFEQIKGLDTLLRAWQLLADKRVDWELHLIGNGSLKDVLVATDGIVVKDFMQPDKLADEIAETGCFVLPSLGEPWGVVIHEFAAAGLPLIVSDVIGAASTFVIVGLNGFSFKAGDAQVLANRMSQVINMSDRELQAMGNISNALSQRISPKTSAGNLLSVSN